MDVSLKKNFLKKLARLPAPIQQQVEAAIQTVRMAQSLAEIPQLKLLAGNRHYYRIRMGDYRIGFFLLGTEAIFESVGSRGDFYKTYPPR